MPIRFGTSMLGRPKCIELPSGRRHRPNIKSGGQGGSEEARTHAWKQWRHPAVQDFHRQQYVYISTYTCIWLCIYGFHIKPMACMALWSLFVLQWFNSTKCLKNPKIMPAFNSLVSENLGLDVNSLKILPFRARFTRSWMNFKWFGQKCSSTVFAFK